MWLVDGEAIEVPCHGSPEADVDQVVAVARRLSERPDQEHEAPIVPAALEALRRPRPEG